MLNTLCDVLVTIMGVPVRFSRFGKLESCTKFPMEAVHNIMKYPWLTMHISLYKNTIDVTLCVVYMFYLFIDILSISHNQKPQTEFPLTEFGPQRYHKFIQRFERFSYILALVWTSNLWAVEWVLYQTSQWTNMRTGLRTDGRTGVRTEVCLVVWHANRCTSWIVGRWNE